MMMLNRGSFISRYYVDEWSMDRIAEEAGCHRETLRIHRLQWRLPDRDRDWDDDEWPSCLDAISRCTSGASLVGDMRTLAFDLQRRTSELMDRLTGQWLQRYAPHVDVIPSGIGRPKMEQPSLRLTKLSPDAIVPVRQSDLAAGIDLHSTEEHVLRPGEQHTFGTGIAGAIPQGWVGMVCPRSGLAAKHGVTVQNAPGIIDSDYRGEWLVILHNTGATGQPYKVGRGDRIAQVVVVPCLCVAVQEVARLDETQRGAGGLGSTGK